MGGLIACQLSSPQRYGAAFGMAWSLLDLLRIVRWRYTTFENICSVGSALMTLVAVDVFETDIKHWWCVRISSLLGCYLFNRSPRSKNALCM